MDSPTTWINPDLIGRVLDLAIQIQQIPAPTFHEQCRAVFIRDRFQEEGLSKVSMDESGNVYACLPRQGKLQTITDCLPIVVSAHLDTVFPASTDLSVVSDRERIAGPGIGDNSLGIAGLFGLAWALRSKCSQLPGDVWLVANVGEEGLGNLSGIRAVLERFGEGQFEQAGWRSQKVLAYLILEGMALGQIYHRGVGVSRQRISVNTPGGHSWVDYGRPSAIHVLAELVTRLVTLPLPTRSRTTLNVGVIEGGTSVNTIAAHAHIELDLRSESETGLAELVAHVERLVQAANQPNVGVIAKTVGQRPAGEIPEDHPLVRLAVKALEAQGIQPCLNAGSTDANLPLSLGLPAICLGLTNGCGAHTTEEAIYTSPLAQGLNQLVWLIEHAFQKLSPRAYHSGL